MLQVLVIVVSALFTFLSVARADQCPHLEGHFACPARAGQPPYTLAISQSGNVRRTVQYTWAYDNGSRVVTQQASEQGILNAPATYALCRNKVLYLSPSAADFSDSTRYFVNKVGDYVGLAFMGQPVVTCKSQPQK